MASVYLSPRWIDRLALPVETSRTARKIRHQKQEAEQHQTATTNISAASDPQILEETSSISLHSKEIYIMEASFVAAPGDGEGAAAGKPMEASAISFDLKLSTATFSFPEPLAKGKGVLKLTFQCEINNQVGFVVGGGEDFVRGGRSGGGGGMQ